MNFVKKQYVYLLLLGCILALFGFIWLKSPYSDDQKLTATMFVFTIGLLIGVFNNNLSDKQTIMQLQSEKQLKNLKTEILDAISTTAKSLETSLTAKINGVDSTQTSNSKSLEKSLSDQINDLKVRVGVIDTNVNSLDKNLTSLTRVLIDKDLIKPF